MNYLYIVFLCIVGVFIDKYKVLLIVFGRFIWRFFVELFFCLFFFCLFSFFWGGIIKFL